MRKLLLFKLFVLFIFSSVSLSYAQETGDNEFSVSAQIRPRAEYRNGVLSPRNEGQLPASFINNRARISADYKRSNLSMRLSAQHVGVWGQDPQVENDGRFMLNEAWAKFNINPYFFAQLGRQSLVYDDERILGGLDWNVSGRFHDALKLGYEQDANKLHLILAFNQNGERRIGGTYYAPGGQPYKTMQTLWYQYSKVQQPFSASVIAMNLGLEGGTADSAKTNYMQTIGTNLNYQLDKWKFTGIFYYQMGKTATNVNINAFMAGLNVKYNITNRWDITLGSEYLSGDKENDSKYQAFNPLYGTHHKFYGYMDYFYASAFTDGMNPGLWDNFISISYKPSQKTNLLLNYHYFNMAADISVDGEKISKGLGSEIDFQFDWNIMNDVKLSAGYSFMLGTSSMNIVKGGNHKSWQDWAWLSININPRIFSSKW